jgi:hypothetical protein
MIALGTSDERLLACVGDCVTSCRDVAGTTHPARSFTSAGTGDYRAAVQSDITGKVREIIAGHLGVDPGRATELTDVAADQIDTVGDLMRVIEGGR